MTDFVISEDELDALDNMDQNDFIIDVLERIHSRKLSDELKKERERVLDKLRQWGTNDGFVQLDTNTGKHFVIYIQDLKDKIESLQGEP